MNYRTPRRQSKVVRSNSPAIRKRSTVSLKLEHLEDRFAPASLLDFGDAPDTYGTVLSSGGARHELVAGPTLGILRDGEVDGQPHSFAQGDDSQANDDEDGVFAANLVLGQTTTFTINVSGGPAKLDAWVDFNRNGVFEDTFERVTASGGTPVGNGANALAVNTPADTAFGRTYARFRLSTAGGLTPTGSAADGEVEDRTLFIYATTQIAFESNYSLHVMDADGANRTALSHAGSSEFHPTWSPDGGTIAFSSYQNFPKYEIYGMDSDGWNRQRLTNIGTSGDGFGTPAWSPDGTKIAMIKVAFPGPDIYSMNADGTGLTRLTNDGAGNSYPTWSPAGTQLAFTSFSSLYVINADGTGRRQLFAVPHGEVATHPAWSPDGTRIAFAGYRNGRSGIYVVNADGTGERKLTPDTETDTLSGYPAWSPNGNQLVFSGKFGGQEGMYVINADGTGFARITNEPGNYAHASWGGIVTPRHIDLGDASDTYGTTLAKDGARHRLGGPRLGSLIDREANGQPHSLANGDDASGSDDEDGVVAGTMTFGQTATFTIHVTGVPGKVDAWVDFNRNGSFEERERITAPAGTPVSVGANTLTIMPPDNVSIGLTYARFRLSSAGGLAPTGSADDGEVEDVALHIQTPQGGVDTPGDMGDAPDTYGTTLANNGARHFVAGPRLGLLADGEVESQPHSFAQGDDSSGVDDEDGVFAANLILGQRTTFTINVSGGPAKLDAWVDFNRNGVFDSSERITAAEGMPVVTGANTLSVTPRSSSSVGLTYARFRLSTAGGLAPTGTAVDGEVEDQPLYIYGSTKIVYSGVNHVALISPDGLEKTNLVETAANNAAWSPDGSKLVVASGVVYSINRDGTGKVTLTSPPAGRRDEDAAWSPDGSRITFRRYFNGTYETYVMNADGTGRTLLPVSGSQVTWAPDGRKIAYFATRSQIPGLYVMNLSDRSETHIATVTPNAGFPAWSPDGSKIAFSEGFGDIYVMNADGTGLKQLTSGSSPDFNPAWSPDGSKIAFAAIVDGFSSSVFVINADGSGLTRLTQPGVTDPAPAWGGLLVPTSLPNTEGAGTFDFGDAPDSYGTVATSNGAKHQRLGPMLGKLRDDDITGQPHFFAQGDDGLDDDDEDGVFAANLVLGQTTTFTIHVANAPGKLDAWVDFNRNGVFDDAAERITAAGGTPVIVGTNTITVTPPAETAFGLTYARFRLSTTGGLSSTGSAADGEVEDHPLYVYAATKIRYYSSDGIVVMNPDGSDATKQPSGAASGFLSPDGSKTSFVRGENLYVANADGSQEKLLVAGYRFFDTLWSPDGTRIVFDGYLLSGPFNIDIHVVDVNTSSLTRLTTGPEQDIEPSWSPDGRRIAFKAGVSGGGKDRIDIMNADGTGRKPFVVGGDGGTTNVFSVSWSPDGRSIAFAGGNDLFIKDVNTAVISQVTRTQLVEQTSTWSPDGGRIATQTTNQDDMSFRITVFNADGTNLAQVTQTQSFSPLWYGIVTAKPNAHAGGPYSVSAGGSVILSGAASSDSDGSIVSYEWDLDNNGTFEVGPSSSPTAVFSAAGLPSGQRGVRLRVTDNLGAKSVGTTTVNVLNTPPTISAFSGDWLPEGAVYVLRLGNVVDPDPDTVTSYRINWGDGTSTTAAGDPSGRTVMHVYKDEGNYTVTIDLTDEDGTHLAAGTKSIRVENVATFLTSSVSDSLAVDRNSNGVADAGDVIEYTATVTNDGPDHATNVSYTPQLDPNMTLVPPASATSNAVVFSDNFDGGLERWMQNAPGFGVSGGRIVGASGHLVNLATIAASQSDVRLEAHYDLRWSTEFNHFGLVARQQGAADDRNMYAGIVYGTPGSFVAGIWRNIGGRWSELASAPTSVAAGALRFEAVGGALRLLVNDVLVATTFDVTFREGRSGVRLGTGIFADSFNVTRLGSSIFRDDFDRDPSPDVGPAHVEGPAESMVGDYRVQNGKLVGVGGFVNIAVSAASALGDVSVQADINLNGNGFEHAGVVARYQGPGDNNMYAGLVFGVGGEYYSLLWKNVFGAGQVLDHRPVSGPAGSLRLDVIGAALKLYFNEALVGEAMDSSITSPGLAGVRASNQAIDNLSIAPLALPTSPVQNLGTLLAGESKRAVYRAVVNNPLPANVTRVSHQGSVVGTDSGTGIAYAPVSTNTVSRNVEAAPDMRIAVSGPAEVQTEDDIVYTIDLVNLGTQTATGVRVVVSFPIDMTSRGGNIDGQAVAWTPANGQTFELIVGDVAARTNKRLALVVKPTMTYHATGQMTASATVGDDGTQGSDLNPSNNTREHTLLLRGPQHPFLDW